MVPENQVTIPTTSAPLALSLRFWVRCRFRKDGDLRLVSHHDLMHCFERMLRRAALPFRSSEGFHPKPRLHFPLSLALGIIGCNEVVEIELAHPSSCEEILKSLQSQAPSGLTILSVQPRPAKSKAQVRRACYHFPVLVSEQKRLEPDIAQLLATPQIFVQRIQPRRRTLDIRPYISALHFQAGFLVMDFWVTPTGTARPDEILNCLGLRDYLVEGAILQRVNLELTDEVANDNCLTPKSQGLPFNLQGLPFSARSRALNGKPQP